MKDIFETGKKDQTSYFQEQLDNKQNHSTNLDDFSEIEMSEDVRTMMEADNKGQMQDHLELGSAAFEEKEIFAQASHSHPDIEEEITQKATSSALSALSTAFSSFIASIKAVAFSNDYRDLSNLPTIPAAQAQSDWNQATNTSPDFIKNKPSIPASQIQSDWAQSNNSVKDFIKNKPSSLLNAYQNLTQRAACFPIFRSGAVGSGTVIFHLTVDGTSGGSPLFPNGIIEESINCFVSDALASYQISYAFTNLNKTITLTANKLTTANILTGILGQAQANAATVRLQVWGY